MQIRTCDVTDADKQSAKVFFDALRSFYKIGDEALDMFARDGALTVSQYAYKVPQIDVWELNEEHRKKLQDFRPRDLIIGCSYTSMGACDRKYDMVVIDTPQGLHADAGGVKHVEHFDVLGHIRGLLKPQALIVLYVNKRPYNKDEKGSHGYDQYDEYDFKRWMAARNSFYDVENGNISEEDALMAYRDLLASQDIVVKSTLIVPCHSDVEGLEPYAFRLALEVELV